MKLVTGFFISTDFNLRNKFCFWQIFVIALDEFPNYFILSTQKLAAAIRSSPKAIARTIIGVMLLAIIVTNTADSVNFWRRNVAKKTQKRTKESFYG